ncbi:MAG: fimbrillin family protein [Bacteroides sp.]|nr:fimbrillin family protein [Bacteroides sp.]MCM1095297.1 fimbrillin family protein [Terasakiella sp.]
MKAKKFLMAFAAIAAISTVSCTQEEELLVNSGNGQTPDGDAVAFGTYLASAPESRAEVMDLPALKEKGFGVFAFHTGAEDYKIKDPKHVPNFMYNQEVTWADNADGGMWQYSPVKYWPSNTAEKVSFFAYAPYIETPGATGITAFTANTAEGDPKLSFKMDEDVDKQVDLLYSNNAMDIRKQAIAEKVDFRFKHALSRIGFKRVAVVDEFNGENGTDDDNFNPNPTGKPNYNPHSVKLTDKSTVVINSVAISSSDFGDSGDFNLRTGEWENYVAKSHTYTLTAENGDFINNTLTPDDATTVMRLTDDDKYLMVMPTPVVDRYSNEKIPVMVTVNFDVITEDPKLAGGQSKITSEITAPFNFEFQAGKTYNFVLHIGLTSVKLDATVEDWSENNHGGWENIIVNTPVNNAYTLVLDALDGRFRNGSSVYIMSKIDMDLEAGEVGDAVFKIPYFYNNKSHEDWADPANDIYWQYQLNNYGFTCWCDHIVELLEAPMELHDKYEGQGRFKGFKYYSPTPLLFEDKWAHEYDPTAPDLLIPSETSITIPVDDPTRFRILYAVWPIGENHLD